MIFNIRNIFGLFILLISLNAHSWNALGHMVVAQIAYNNLNHSAKQQVDTLLNEFSTEYSDIDKFYLLGPWADTLRSQKIESYNHWHYTDHPFTDDESPLVDIVDTDNAVWAIEKMVPVIANKKAKTIERARFMAFLTHVVADLHQPLHTSSRISKEHPYGDLGGNLYYVKYPESKPKKIALHKLWDQGVDIFLAKANEENMLSLVNSITAEFPKSYFGEKVLDIDPNNWAQEGLKISISVVYDTPQNKLPSSKYISNGKKLAKMQVALAGYRLAEELNYLFA